MANTTVYPFGQGGVLPSGYPIADDLNTDSAQQALAARQGKVIGEVLAKMDYNYKTVVAKVIVSKTSGYIDTSGAKKTSTVSAYSAPIFVKSGETLIVTTNSNNLSVISTCDSDGTNIVPVVTETDNSGTETRTYSYTAKGADVYCIACFNNNNGVVSMSRYLDGANSPFRFLPYERIYDSSVKYADGTFATSTDFDRTNYVAVEGRSFIKYGRIKTTRSSTTIGIAFYNSSKTYISGITALKSQPVNGYNEEIVMSPDNAAYMILTLQHEGTDFTFGTYGLETSSSPSQSASSSDSWIDAARKRFANLKDTVWTAKGSIPNASGTAYYSNGNSYTGLPYSSTRQIDKYVGYDVTLRTFLSAVNNPYSMLYTENINGGKSASAWGKTYLATECGPYMGIQCSVFVSYIVGLPIYWLTHQYDFAEKMGYIRRIGRPFADNLKEMDILLATSGHDLVVTSISRDGSGNISTIEVSDSHAQLPRTRAYSISTFNTAYSSDDYIHYRVNRVPDIMQYAEDVSGISYNDDICTIGGDYAAFRKGDTIAVSYTAGSYTGMQLYKDDTLLDTITIDASEHYVDLTSRNLAAGFYKARLTDGANYSDYTYFEVIEASVTVNSAQDDTVSISFSGSGSAEYVDFVSASGDSIAKRALTSEELLTGTATIDVSQLNSWMPRYTIPGCYVKVKFRGTYGSVTNAPVSALTD